MPKTYIISLAFILVWCYFQYVNSEITTKCPCTWDSSLIKRSINTTVYIRAFNQKQHNSDRKVVPLDPGVVDSQPISIGSGVLINTDGFILTNYHVIEGFQKISVYMSNSTNIFSTPEIELSARVIATAPKMDLSILKIDDFNPDSLHELYNIIEPRPTKNNTKLDIYPFTLGDSDKIELGENILIIGYPSIGGASITITQGIISGLSQNNEYIKTDAEINPGNSGGIAINSNMEIIGIVTAVQTVQHSSIPGKIGMIIPINKVRKLIEYYNTRLPDNVIKTN